MAVTDINTAVTETLKAMEPPQKEKKSIPKLKFITHYFYMAIKAKKDTKTKRILRMANQRQTR